MKIVLDTNVLVSGLRTPFGPGGQTIKLLMTGRLVLLYDSRILLEYMNVLSRPKFGFAPENIDLILRHMETNGLVVLAPPLKKRLPHPDDEPFLEVAFAGHAKCLVTGNKRHFPEKTVQGIPILSPSEFIEYYREQ